MTRDELSTKIMLGYALPISIKRHYEKSDISYLNKIASTDPEDIIKRAKSVMKYWTGENMNEYMGTDIYTLKLLPKHYIPNTPLQWANFVTDDYEELETVLQVYRLFRRIGVNITLLQAHFVWAYVSDSSCAQWLCKMDDEDAWSDILSNFLFNQPKK